MASNWVPDARSKGVEVFVFKPTQAQSSLSLSKRTHSETSNSGWDDFCAQIATAASSSFDRSTASKPSGSSIFDESLIQLQLQQEYSDTPQPQLPTTSSPINQQGTNARLLSRIQQFKLDSDQDDASYAHSDSGSDTSSTSFDTPSHRPRTKALSPARNLKSRRTSHHFDQKRPRVSDSIARPAWLKTLSNSNTKIKKPVQKTKNQIALENLRIVERGSPMHYWTREERTFLCVLNRWYRRSPGVFARIFNRFYSLDLSTRKITAQFENCLRLFGGLAYLEYDAVFSVPFDDPEDVFKDLRGVIENEARALDVEVERLEEEKRSTAEGSAKKAKAPRTRERYKALVRKKGLAQAVERCQEFSGQSGQSSPALGGWAIRAASEIQEEVVDVEESTFPVSRHHQFVDTEESSSLDTGASPTLDAALPSTPPSFSSTPQRTATPPSLAFRVFSTHSRAQLTPTGFRSELFTNWVGDITPPLSRENPLWPVLAANHLSKRSRCESAFISCALSLIQVLNNDVAKGHGDNPQLCLIDLAQLQAQEGKVYAAQEVISDLKKRRQMSWARYKGLSEYMVWGEIPASAIISAVPLAEIEALAGDFLCSELFSPNTKTRTVAGNIKAREIRLGCEEARKMGKLSRLVGLAQPTAVVSLEHLTAFVKALIDGWYIRCDGSPDREVAMTFAATLNTPDYTRSEVMDAFVEGVQRGLENVGFFEGRRRSR